MDIDEEKEVVSTSKKRKLSKAAEAKLKANEKKKKGKKGKKGSDDDDDEDAYTALSKSLWASNTQRPPIGNFEVCSACEKLFTVVSLTPHCSSRLILYKFSDKIYNGIEHGRRISLSQVCESWRKRSF